MTTTTQEAVTATPTNITDILNGTDSPLDVVRAIHDPMRRAVAAEQLRRAADTNAKETRHLRDTAALTVAWPWLTITEEYEDQEAAAKSWVASTKPDPGAPVPKGYLDAVGALDRLRDEKNAKLRETTPPVDIINAIGVSKNLWVRTTQRASGAVNPGVPNAETVMVSAANDLTRWVDLQNEARQLRDATFAELFKDPTITNADIVRATGLTSARIAQLRGDWMRAGGASTAES